MKGKLIVITGTDCSGKETQAKKLVEKLEQNGKRVFEISFPNYNSPSGKIVGGPYLGKSYISEGWFPETAPNVDALVASSYYAADRRYSKNEIEKHLDNGEIVIIDRWVESNMAHQGGKLKTKEERLKMYKKLEMLEYEIMELPKPDLIVFLYMPYQYANQLKKDRKEKPDQHENSKDHLVNAENTFLELTELYHFSKVNCVKDGCIRSIEDIHEDIYSLVEKIKG